jgi:hypothetical protein
VTLPGALRRFRHELDIFPSEIQSALGRLLPPLARLLGNESSASDYSEAPDGFDGVVRRGPYERLLASEWGLHSVAPLEFLRRAADAEHAFYALSYEQPRSRRGSVVLLDSGAEQLGGCRIVQLALLVLLHERARRQGARFRWRSLSDSSQALHTGLDAVAVRGFLTARSAFVTEAAHAISAAREHAEEESWLIGSPRLLAQAPDVAHAIALRERPEPGPEAVEVALLGRAPRRVTLELPKGPIATRLLRNPFDAPKPLRLARSERPSAGFSINAQGNRVFYLTEDGRLASLTSNLGRTTVAPPRFYESSNGMQIVAAGSAHKRVNWLSVSRGLVAVQSSKVLRPGGARVATCPGPLLSAGETLWPLELSTNPVCAAFVASDRSLFRVDFDRQLCEPLASGVSALTSLGSGTIAATVEKGQKGGPCVIIAGPTTLREVRYEHAGAVSDLRAVNAHRLFLGRHEGDRYHIACLLADRGETWDERTLRPPSGTTVIGIVEASGSAADAGLLLLDEDRRRLSTVARAHSYDVLRSDTPISEVQIASWHGRVAYRTRDYRVGFVSGRGQGHVWFDVGGT